MGTRVVTVLIESFQTSSRPPSVFDSVFAMPALQQPSTLQLSYCHPVNASSGPHDASCCVHDHVHSAIPPWLCCAAPLQPLCSVQYNLSLLQLPARWLVHCQPRQAQVCFLSKSQQLYLSSWLVGKRCLGHRCKHEPHSHRCHGAAAWQGSGIVLQALQSIAACTVAYQHSANTLIRIVITSASRSQPQTEQARRCHARL